MTVMTIAESKGFVVGGLYRIKNDIDLTGIGANRDERDHFQHGSIVKLRYDDESICPQFQLPENEYVTAYIQLNDLEPATAKPAIASLSFGIENGQSTFRIGRVLSKDEIFKILDILG